MKLLHWALALIAVLLLGAPAKAADWLLLLGTESGAPDEPLRPLVFVQPLAQAVLFPDRVSGLTSAKLAPYNGQHAGFNVLSGDDAQSSFSLRRVRLGLKGSVPDTEQAINYFVAAELGDNASTTDGPILIDASATFNSPWGPRLRAGQFKLAMMDETLEAVHVTADLIDFSVVAARLLQERRVENGQQVGAAYAFRDTGLMLFDTIGFGPMRLSYAATLTNGAPRTLDGDDDKDVGARLQLAWLPKPKQEYKPERDEAALFGWALSGRREVTPGQRERRLRAGGGAQLRTGPLRVRVEGVYAKGVLPTGASPPFAGQPVAVSATGDAWGVTALIGTRITPKLETDVALHRLDQEPDGGPTRRIFWESVFGAQWFFNPRAKVAVNLALRKIEAPDAGADARRIVGTIAPKAGVQATVRY
ncbi:MAG: hypothetical protein KC776_38630 [Myxococcales bacterium]|nr:hypothetical protein [Myxococcales bacterium]MCB9576208.1 hypothetical protein [Polyangiaceae bacterium]